MSTVKYFVYEWCNITSGKKYIGKHIGNEDDGYIGSGVYFIKAYKKEPHNFKRTILGYYENKEKMNEAEEVCLKEVDAANNPNYYNLTNLSGGGNLHSHLSEERKKEIYSIAQQASREHLRNNLESVRKKKIESWNNSPKKKLHSERTRKRRIQEELNKTEEDRLKFSETCQKAYWGRDSLEIENHIKSISKGVKDSYKNIPGLLEERTEHFKNINKGRIAINKEGVIKRIYPSDKEKYLNDGWFIGRGKRKK